MTNFCIITPAGQRLGWTSAILDELDRYERETVQTVTLEPAPNGWTPTDNGAAPAGHVGVIRP